MVHGPIKLLIVEDSEDDAVLLCAEISNAGLELESRRVDSEAQMRAALAESDWHAVVSDHAMPAFDSLEALRVLKESGKDIPLIVYSGSIMEQTAVSALQAGVQDCVIKGNAARLVSSIERELQNAEIRRAKEEAERHVHRLAYYDDLTGLPNRNYFLERVRNTLDRAARAAVLFIDLNRFMRINSTFGYAAGDALMCQIAERLVACAGQEVLLARFRGDEFGILIENGSLAQAQELAERVVDALAPPFMQDNLEFFITASVGICAYPDDGVDAQALLKNAANAAAYAKTPWRNSYQHFAREMGDAVSQKVVLEASLRRAIERDELFLQFQPIANLQGSGVSGFEALVRWRHPELGVIPPDRFIPLADECGQIIEIGEWVLRAACRETQRWHRAGYDWLTLSVNVSAVQFAQPQLVSQISSVLEETGLPPQYLTVEITESVLMENAELAVRTLRELKQKGIKVAMDDFGTGYSSLSYLKRFSIDILKIDKTFVRDVSQDAESAAIVGAIMALAKSLRLSVVAEGVETPEQLEFIRRIGCDRMQGYLFNRPLDAASLLEYIATLHPLHIPHPAGSAALVNPPHAPPLGRILSPPELTLPSVL